VQESDSEAYKWFKSAVEKINACHYELGAMYFLGRGVDMDYKAAAEMLQEESETKYPYPPHQQADAALLLGFIYEEGGHGIEQDYSAAARWYKYVIGLPKLWGRDNEPTLAHALVDLGDLYVRGSGVPQDYSEALKLFTQAGEKGDVKAQIRVGSLYEDGKGAPQNDAEAVKWYRLAAEQGNASAQSSMGFAYSRGQGVPQDYVLAHMWYNLSAAAEQYTHIAQTLRDFVARDMTKDQIAEAQRLAREWKPKKPLTKKQ
jgi:hypothetical protein